MGRTNGLTTKDDISEVSQGPDPDRGQVLHLPSLTPLGLCRTSAEELVTKGTGALSRAQRKQGRILDAREGIRQDFKEGHFSCLAVQGAASRKRITTAPAKREKKGWVSALF